mmetsp:Transcript_44313/g.77770  ORF Transcript_44313/g.77770 Transcript_44313/m.77770 type:complete len:1232 (-) Transcript_44313:145-3840(-)
MMASARTPEQNGGETQYSGTDVGKRYWSCIGYTFFCVLICGLVAALAALAWSSIGFGADCLIFLQDAAGYLNVSAAVLGIAFLVLYMLDFFSPPHMPGRYCILFEGDCIIGPTLVGIVGGAFFVCCLLMAKEYPSTPILATTFLGPVGLVCLRSAMTAKQEPPPDDIKASLKADGDDRSVLVLKFLVGEERDQLNFFIAASSAFLFTAFACLAIWLPWAILRGHQLDEMEDKAKDDRELEVLYILWAAPLVLAVSDLLFGIILYLRVYMGRAYAATNQARNKNIVDFLNSKTGSCQLRKSELAQQIGRSSAEVAMDERKRQDFLDQHHNNMHQLVQIVRIVGCILVFKVGATYVSFSLVAVDSHIASMVQNFLGALFFFFIGFVYTSFKRLWDHMEMWLKGSSLWKKAMGTIRSNWWRAAILGIFLPLLPLVVLLSMVNQLVRRCRGLAQSTRPGTASSRLVEDRGDNETLTTVEKNEVDDANSFTGRCLTQRVHKQLVAMRKWPFVQIVLWVYYWSIIVVVLVLSPRLLNVFLSAMSKLLEGMPFPALLLLTFLIGIVCFLLPPVPGAPVYFFAGAMFTKACPWGFWAGATVSILTGWLMKLAACAMQQKLIGEQLGGKLWVRSLCGVHKPFIRTIECVLSKPGLSMGKVAILCGGPDWPTSVLAGILKLSVLQCELGTLPIIFFIAPFSLSGSFYLKRDEGEIWARAGNLMFTATGFVCVLLWAIMAWAWQKEFDEKFEYVTQPMEKYIELDWSDYRLQEFKRSCDVTWQDVPCVLKVIYAGGGILLVLVCHMFWWNTDSCFGEFAVTDDIDSLVAYGPDGLVKFNGAVGLGLFLLGLLGWFIFSRWRKRRIRKPITALNVKLAETEASWKQKRLVEVRTAAKRQQAQRPSGVPLPSTVSSSSLGSTTSGGKALRGVIYNIGGSQSSGGCKAVRGADTILPRGLSCDQSPLQSTATPADCDDSPHGHQQEENPVIAAVVPMQWSDHETEEEQSPILQPQPNSSASLRTETEHAGTENANTDEASPPASPQPKKPKKVVKRRKRTSTHQSKEDFNEENAEADEAEVDELAVKGASDAEPPSASETPMPAPATSLPDGTEGGVAVSISSAGLEESIEPVTKSRADSLLSQEPVAMMGTENRSGKEPVKKVKLKDRSGPSQEAGPTTISSDRETDVPSAEEVEDKPELVSVMITEQEVPGTSESPPPTLSSPDPAARLASRGSLFGGDQSDS